jgi:hypothetical protein
MKLIEIIAILIQIESGGVDHAIGDNGDALGCLQIHAIYVEDVNRIYKTNYKHRDALDRKKAIEMTQLYLMHYTTKERLGRQPHIQDFVRNHNGGPNGYKKKATIKYWEKFQKARDGN